MARKREYENEAARQKAYRERFKRKINAQLRAVRWCKQFCSLILDNYDPRGLRKLASRVAAELVKPGKQRNKIKELNEQRRLEGIAERKYGDVEPLLRAVEERRQLRRALYKEAL